MAQRPLPQQLLDRADLWLGRRAAAVDAEATGHPALDRLLPGGGWPRRALSGILAPAAGVGEFGLMLPLLVRLSRAGRRIAFVAPPHVPYAPALARAGVVLEQFWVVECSGTADSLWAIEQLLRCPAAGVVAGWLGQADERGLRRLQLAAEEGGAIGLLHRPAKARHQVNVAALRLAVSLSPAGSMVEVLKARGGRVGQSALLSSP